MLISAECNLCKHGNAAVVYPATLSDACGSNPQCVCTNTGHGEYYQVVRCNRCGLVYCFPRPDNSALEDGYCEVRDELYEDEAEGRMRTFARNAAYVSRFKRTGKLLDVGCALGLFLVQAQRAGFDARGIEPSRWCAQEGIKKFGVRIHNGTYRDVGAYQKEFDVITLWDVLEHVDDPLDALVRCAGALKDDGVLVFSTIDIGSLYAKILGKRWPWLMKMHIYYFDKRTIKKYLEKAGFELEDMSVYCHVVSVKYFLYKLKTLSTGLHAAAKNIHNLFSRKRDGYLTIGMGDVMQVCARKKTASTASEKKAARDD